MSYKGFTQVKLTKPGRSTFDLSHEKRISSRMGKLTPVLITETVPNDTFYGSTEVLIKMAPMLAPIYHRLNLYVHYFFIPNRLLWKDWETFITGGRLGEAVSTPPVPPRFSISGALDEHANRLDTGSLADYLGVPPIPDASSSYYVGKSLDAMPFLAVYRAWYDYYRDRNYVPDNTLLPAASGGLGSYNQFMIGRYRAWQHDYYTSALPFTQRGAEVLMPLQGSGSVNYKPISDLVTSPSNLDLDGPLQGAGGQLQNNSGQYGRVENIDSIQVTSSDVSINDFRRAVALQQYLERNALAGTRYPEWTMAHFARKSSDARLQRAEYLGGGKAVIQISEVMTTAYSEDGSGDIVPPANMSGRGSTYANTNKFSYNCEEHGFIIGMLSVMPTSSYMQGLPRMFQQRNTFLDYPVPSFAHLGEQEVFDYEIFLDVNNITNDRSAQPLFGYQSRYADWKHIQSSSHGDFRTNLDFWHLTRKFVSTPNLGENFVTFEDTLQDRIFAVEGVDTLWMYVYNKLSVKRSLPYFGTPML